MEELWKYIEILRDTKQSWFFKKNNLEERVDALKNILELGSSSVIKSLMPFLRDNEVKVQEATCYVIIELFKRIETKNGYYDTLKYCDISKSDIDYFKQFSPEKQIYLFAIATLNGNGYIREKAIKSLSETSDGKAIPFIVYRLNDWVEQVRQVALKSIEKFKKPEFLNSLIDNLPVFEWLQKNQRADSSSLYKEIMNYVIVEHKQYVIDNFATFSDKTRFIIAKQMCHYEKVLLEDLQLLLADKHFLIRSFALLHFDKLSQREVDNLLKDKSSRIRIQTLYQMKDKANFLELAYSFLADNSTSIREFARYSLKAQITDFATIYNDNLKKVHHVIGSLKGLAETSGTQFKESVIPFLMDEKIKIRKTAFLALTKLDREKAYIIALQNLDNEHIGIRNLAVDFLSRHVTEEVLQKAREIYKTGKYDLKKSMLKLFGMIGRWSAIPDIMIATIDDNENIRKLGLSYLQQWRKNATTYFTEPKSGELERSNQVFRFVFEIHEEKKYYDQNPLTGIDFYLR